MSKVNIHGLTLKDLEQVLAGWKEKSFHAQQIFSWLYKRGATEFKAMSDLSESLRECLEDNFSILDLELENRIKSLDGTEKFLLKLKDGNFIEAVNIPAQERVTGCISTQVGCKFACSFCASGISGFRRNLSCAEMIEEVLYLKNNLYDGKLTHLVFMGTGEPLDNYDDVLKAIRIINSKDGLNIGARRITVSTSGIIPGIEKLAQENLQIELSVSLHTADDKTRSALMPVNKKYPLKDLIAASKDYIKKTNRQITFEYVLIKNLNADLASAQRLSALLKDLKLAKVNLIPSNPIKELEIEPPKKQDILFFKDYLAKHGLNVTLRKARGQDIEAACGQLRLRHEKG